MFGTTGTSRPVSLAACREHKVGVCSVTSHIGNTSGAVLSANIRLHAASSRLAHGLHLKKPFPTAAHFLFNVLFVETASDLLGNSFVISASCRKTDSIKALVSKSELSDR